MNLIKAELDKSDYNDSWFFLNYRIDSFWLDEELDNLYPGSLYKGLIPTLLYGLMDKEEEIVWKTILPSKGEISVCPILMCPDDYDFSCTLIVVEIENYGSFIQWKQLGIDKRTKWFDDEIRYDINWLPELQSLNFEFKDYQKMIQDFQEQYRLDKLKDNDNLCQSTVMPSSAIKQ
ncbi:hypothetical protein [Dysgonomonas gadei]|uniref:Uncharacterized protein n=1 Tax=Dysgonomonas gadei ATCC BAA-286 TaxID=742766 RepID=F5J2B1_9BACT|nr:hypothetical protein [Dysgonomonas gadei]EGK00146.1 hypothetical protein HMPREF9455_03478 [Dysgonomonas gadei ATCC BAA-286]